MKKRIILPFLFFCGTMHAQTMAEYVTSADDAYNRGSFEEAAGYYERALALDTAGVDYMSACQLGLCYVKLQNYPKALVQFKYSLIKGNDDRSLFTQLKNCTEAMNCPSCLEETYKEIEAQAPAWHSFLQEKLFYIYAGQQRHREALQAASAVLSANPGHFGMLKNGGLVYNSVNQPDSAVLYLERAHELKPEDVVVNKTLGLLYYTICEEKMGAENRRYEKLKSKGSSQYNTLLYNRQNLAREYYPKAVNYLSAANGSLNDPELTKLIDRLKDMLKVLND